MKVTYLAVQKFVKTPKIGLSSTHCKVHYLCDGDRSNQFDDDDGSQCSFEYIGKKVEFIPLDVNSMSQFNGLKSGSIVDLNVQPNPSKPRENICFGVLS